MDFALNPAEEASGRCSKGSVAQSLHRTLIPEGTVNNSVFVSLPSFRFLGFPFSLPLTATLLPMSETMGDEQQKQTLFPAGNCGGGKNGNN